MYLDILKFIVVLAVMTVLVVPVGAWLAKTFTDEHHYLVECLIYRLFGIDPDKESGWKMYGVELLLANAAMMLLGYLLLRFQGWLPLNPMDLPPQDPDQAFNTAASFITNTNWQSYSGETLSNFDQMAVITFLMFVGAATGVAAGAAFIRGLGRQSSDTLGNFWVDMTRVICRIFLPVCFLLALVFVWQGVPQTLDSRVLVSTLEGGQQAIRIGPVASLESIKHIGTNGGGFFSMNSAHPFENPTPLTNVLEILGMLLIPSALTYAFGSMLSRRRQGWVFFSAFLVMFSSSLFVMYTSAQYGNPLLESVGVQQDLPVSGTGGSLEGKEMRFGIAGTSLFAVTTTAATTGSVNAMHDSLVPLAGGVALWQMMLNTVFGGDGVGFINLMMYAILGVFLIGMMIGRSPEFLGKKVEAREVKLVMLAMLAHPVTLLGFTALSVVWPGTANNLGNSGAHGFTEYLYAYASGTANNGSCFCGLDADTPFFNTTIGLAMLFGRYLTLLPMLAVAGSMASKRSVPASDGTLDTATPTFAMVLVAVVLILGGLTFFPALALGPLAEHFQMLSSIG